MSESKHHYYCLDRFIDIPFTFDLEQRSSASAAAVPARTVHISPSM